MKDKAHLKFGLRYEPNRSRELYSTLNNVKYARYPVETPLVNIGDELYSFIEKYGFKYYKQGDIFCISSKIISITEKLIVHRNQVKISILARLIVKFVKKWPSDYGYSLPEKMQVAINIVGYPRILLALLCGVIMKIFGKPGYFYIIAGHKINAIDGFIPTAMKPFNEYAFLPPLNGDEIAEGIYNRFGMQVAIIDGNNIDNNIMGTSNKLKLRFGEEYITKLMTILHGNPQGQDDDGNITPILIIREIKNG